MRVLDNSCGLPQHILMTADTAGGVWTYAMELCRMFSRSHIHVSLATMGPPVAAHHRAELRKLSNVDLFESQYSLEWMDDADRDFERSSEWLRTLADRLRPDMVHLNGYSHAVLTWRAPVVVVAHSCVLSWYAAVNPGARLDHLAAYRDRVAAGLKHADVVIAPSQAMLREIERLYGTLASTAVIPNGRTPEQFLPGEKADVILATGRLWDEAKNLRMLDSIAPRLPWPVYLAGEALHPNGTHSGVQHARHLGALAASELRPWFSRAAIYVAPARYEPFGLSILEAALAACALVLADIPSLRENWDGVALFAPSDDPDQFETAICDLIQDSARRRELAASAAARAQQFSPSSMARGYLQAYRDAKEQFLNGTRWQGEARIA